ERQLRLPGNGTFGHSAHLEGSYREHVAIMERLERGQLDAALSCLRSHLRARLAALTGTPGQQRSR
ncbi:MAG TPA: hypothetical protein VES02_02450, partial [Dermatophilaceae bacterium]|nr:hypothetical protein [Dermatophilaceae bacterium]